MGRYEQIGSWQVSLAVPAKVRDLFREQTADLLLHQPSSWVRRFCNTASHSFLECLLVGGTMFVPPDPFYDPQFYLQGGCCGPCADRYDDARRMVQGYLDKLETLRRDGPAKQLVYWEAMLSQIQGDELITRTSPQLSPLADPERSGEYAAVIRINYLTRAARIEPMH